MFLASPLVAVGIQRFPGARLPASICGLAIMVTGLVAASFCNGAGALLATQGVMYAIGGLILYFPAMYLIDEWFVARKGLAFGVVWTGTGTAGAIVPFLLQWLLDDYGFRTALRVWAVILVSDPRGGASYRMTWLTMGFAIGNTRTAFGIGHEEPPTRNWTQNKSST